MRHPNYKNGFQHICNLFWQLQELFNHHSLDNYAAVQMKD